jgi:hypothetical protein
MVQLSAEAMVTQSLPRRAAKAAVMRVIAERRHGGGLLSKLAQLLRR